MTNNIISIASALTIVAASHSEIKSISRDVERDVRYARRLTTQIKPLLPLFRRLAAFEYAASQPTDVSMAGDIYMFSLGAAYGVKHYSLNPTNAPSAIVIDAVKDWRSQ